MRVLFENLEIVGHHGVYEEERAEGRRFRVDMAVRVATWPISDDPGDILDYRRLARIATDIIEDGPTRNLLETLAWDIVDRTFDQHDEVRELDLTLRKAATGVPGDPEWVGVCTNITRERWARGQR